MTLRAAPPAVQHVSDAIPIRVLIVDGNSEHRRLFRLAFGNEPDIQVTDAVPTGGLALARARLRAPDVVLCSLHLPDTTPADLLTAMSVANGGVAALLVDTGTNTAAWPVLSHPGAMVEVWSLATRSAAPAALGDLRAVLPARVRSVYRARTTRNLLRHARAGLPKPAQAAAVPLGISPARTTPLATGRPCAPQVVVIGVSTGGPAALGRLLPALPADLGVPVLVVQHIPATFSALLAADLDARCGLAVRLAEADMPIVAGTVYLAPGGRHLAVVPGTNGPVARICDDPPENSCRPSADVLFRSAADVYGDATLAVVMTGMGCDGLAGARRIRAVGGTVLAQDEGSCVVYGMSRAVIAAGLAEQVLPLDGLAGAILVRTRLRVA